jgi:hypothetical protein
MTAGGKHLIADDCLNEFVAHDDDLCEAHISVEPFDMIFVGELYPSDRLYRLIASVERRLGAHDLGCVSRHRTGDATL